MEKDNKNIIKIQKSNTLYIFQNGNNKKKKEKKISVSVQSKSNSEQIISSATPRQILSTSPNGPVPVMNLIPTGIPVVTQNFNRSNPPPIIPLNHVSSGVYQQPNIYNQPFYHRGYTNYGMQPQQTVIPQQSTPLPSPSVPMNNNLLLQQLQQLSNVLQQQPTQQGLLQTGNNYFSVPYQHHQKQQSSVVDLKNDPRKYNHQNKY